MKFIVAFSLAFLALAVADFKSYHLYKEIEIVPRTQDDVKALRDWMLAGEVDFWPEPRAVQKPAHMLLPPERQSEIFKRLHDLGLSYHIINSNVGRSIAHEKARLDAKPREVDLDDFNRHEDIMNWLDELASNCSPDIECEVYNPGNSHEGREMRVFHMRNPSTSDPITYYLDATIHAREWLAPATLLKIMDHMVNNYGTDPEVTSMVDSHEFYFMPVMNPDGYEYTFTDDRLWRKNRRQNTEVGSDCYGTDLNRNFDFRWCAEGASPLPCTDTYCGSSGGSEPETQVVQDDAARVNEISNLQAWITIHTYGYMWMLPFGNTIDHAGEVCERSEDYEELMRVAELTADAIEARHDTDWLRGNGCEVIYSTTGSTDDYMKGVIGVKHTICAELRGNGFIVNPNQIQPSFEEIWDGLVVMTGEV